MINKKDTICINDLFWDVELANQERIKELNNKWNKEDSEEFIFGICIKPIQLIAIDDSLCEGQSKLTILHELAHAWLWSYGIAKETYTQEELCDITASMDLQWYVQRLFQDSFAEEIEGIGDE